MMPVDLLGRLPTSYVESVQTHLRASLDGGEDAGFLESQFWASVLATPRPSNRSDAWEWETWIAMHQRMFCQTLATFIQDTAQSRRKRRK